MHSNAIMRRECESFAEILLGGFFCSYGLSEGSPNENGMRIDAQVSTQRI